MIWLKWFWVDKFGDDDALSVVFLPQNNSITRSFWFAADENDLNQFKWYGSVDKAILDDWYVYLYPVI